MKFKSEASKHEVLKVADLLGEEDIYIYTFIIAKSGRVMNEIFKI